ncbi:MAG: hypothetical protein Q9162_007574 [Coniocarpon cinnabarinum]
MNALIVGRAIGGIGGDGLYLGAMNIIASHTSLRERPLYFSFFGISWGIGTVMGPIVGGLFTQSPAGWRWSFYLNLVAGGIVIPIYIFCLSQKKSTSVTSLKSRIRRIDFLGFVLWAGALVSLIMAISFGGSQYSWQSAQIIALFCVSGILWLCFGLQQATAFLTTPHDRLFPLVILRSAEMWLLVVHTATSVCILFIALNYVPLYLQFVRGESALRAAINLLPLIFTAVVFMLVTGTFLERLGWYMSWYLVGSALAIIGTALMHTVGIDAPLAHIYGYTVLLSAGLSLYVQASCPVAQAKLKPCDASAAVTVIGCTQVGSIALSLATSNSVFFNRAANGIEHILPNTSRSTIQAGISGVGAPIFDELSAEKKEAVLEVVASAIRDVWAQALAAACLSFALACVMKRERMPKQADRDT